MIREKLIAIDRRYERGYLVVDWFLGKRCNYDCSYCTPDIHDSTSSHIPLENLKSVGNTLVQLYDPSKIKISITGGEPTVHPSYFDLCVYLHSLGVTKITTTTNLTRKSDYYIKLLTYTKALTISHHFEYENSIDFLEKVKIINDSKPSHASIRVQVMYNSQYFDACKQAVSFYKAHNIPFTLRRIRPKGPHSASHDYTDEQLEWFFENIPKEPEQGNAVIFYKTPTEIQTRLVHVNEISGSLKNDFFGWTCNAGLDHIHIDWDGSVYRGTCRQGGALGNINNNFSLPKDPIICQTNKCFCAPEISIRKYSPDVNINEINFTD